MSEPAELLDIGIFLPLRHSLEALLGEFLLDPTLKCAEFVPCALFYPQYNSLWKLLHPFCLILLDLVSASFL